MAKPMRDDLFTPEMVAEMWGCSANHVRNLVKSGRLASFRLGSRLIRIPASAIEEFEAQSKEITDGAPHRQTARTQAPEAIVLVPTKAALAASTKALRGNEGKRPDHLDAENDG